MIRWVSLVVIIIFYAIRWRPSVLKRAAKNKVDPYLLLWEIVILVLIVIQLTDLDPFKFQVPLLVNYIGLIISLAGAVIASLARITLKKNYVPAVAAGAPENLTTGGIYRTVRHPSYLGTFLAFIGFELAMSSYLILVSFIFAAEVVRLINKEEKMLAEKHKEEWRKFTKRTPYKLIPFVY